MTTLDPDLAERLPTSDVPAWAAVGVLGFIALAYWLAVRRTSLPLIVLLTGLVGVCLVWGIS